MCSHRDSNFNATSTFERNRDGFQTSDSKPNKTRVCWSRVGGAKSNEALVVAEGWKDLMFEKRAGTLLEQVNFGLIFLPGPLEGLGVGLQPMPIEILERVASDISAIPLGPSYFLQVMQLVLSYAPVTEIAERMATAIIRADYRLDIDDSRIPVDAVLVAICSLNRRKVDQSDPGDA